MDKDKKDKVIGIFGIGLFFISMASFKITTYYKITLGSDFFTGFVLSLFSIVGLFMARRYLDQLFENR
ncbi:hypothetical protein OAR97_01135 [Arcobacteraceae bacterium]|nr:hypothetical protein [Arcobacteraceae bacterium]